nr:hypothetical protein [uncultured Limnohabitans sp.]
MMKTNTFLLISSLVLGCTSAVANDSVTPREAASKVQWGMSLGLDRYTESKMQLLGTEVGVHARLNGLEALPNWQLEGDVLLGRQKYTSTNTGDMDGVLNIETRWRALAPVYQTGTGQEGLSAGLGLQTLWNDLRGQTSTNHSGYERQATQIWLPVRWTSAATWELEGALLLRGTHTSRLSQANPINADIRNTQTNGAYLQASTRFKLDDGTNLSPFVRITRLGDSDTVKSGGQSWFEPKSTRWQIGAVLNF